MAAIIDTLLEIAVTRPPRAEPIKLHIVNTKQSQPAPETPYPLNGILVDDLHPFKTPQPPEGFTTYGEYVRKMAKALEGTVEEEVSLIFAKGFARALDSPTYGSVTEYLEYMLELAIIAADEKVDMEWSKRLVSELRLDHQSGLARIEYGDGDHGHLDVVAIVAEKPPHMGG